MTLSDPLPLARALSSPAETIRLFADGGGLQRDAWPGVERGGSVSIAIGPEGGWSESERKVARDLGWVTIGLGSTRLRVETAAIAASALLLADLLGE